MFQQPLDIVNRALHRLGLPKMGTSYDQQAGQDLFGDYDKLRRAELRRNLWVFATRQVSLRAFDTTTQLVNFEAYAAGTTYAAGYIVTYGNLTWISLIDANLGNTPGTAATSGQLPWDVYFGPVSANVWNDSIQNTDTTNNTSYNRGELVWYPITGDVYVSLADGNQNDPTAVDTWSATTMYPSGAVVSNNSTNFQSLVARNFGNTPSGITAYWTTVVANPTVSASWKKLASATLSTAPIVYPFGTGPISDQTTFNAFRKPSGYLRMAPQAPKAGANAWLGAHVGNLYGDLTEEGLYFKTGSYSSQRLLRFIADLTDVTAMDDMFCEGLAARMAMEAAPVHAEGRLRACEKIYNDVMGEARTVDAIELGPVEQDEDEWITVRTT